MEQLSGSMHREPEAYNQLMGSLSEEMRHRLGQFEGEITKRNEKKAD